MKLSEKIEKLKASVSRLEQLLSMCPDIAIVKVGTGDAEYYCSHAVTRAAESVEFLTPTSTYNAIHKACVYKDYLIDGVNIRVYGYPLMSKLFIMMGDSNTIRCYDYQEAFEEAGVKSSVIKDMHLYVINYIQTHKVDVDKDHLPDNIKNLLAFI
jgi:hypothetical protein